ncbi:MAG: alpha/beta hydrolase fold domain-containing protein [Solirubrobacterales bacterium]|nr:alpha/beta hydrolase fold domain-containing protein [Solirubrobacterales bacterium]MBV9472750.1 alpha/beta hydrolase fold domain-containing protein [Solirubrobacterales bacterium]
MLAPVSRLALAERASSGAPEALLVLHHGRGADERDLLALADQLDPNRRLYVAAPRAPMTVPGWPGYHWYAVPRVGYPDPATFRAAYRALAMLHDQLWERLGISPARTVLGGFSMGAVMSYALALAADRPPPAGVLAFSGFVPTVEGWRAELERRRDSRVFIAHGRRDGTIPVQFARQARDFLSGAELEVEYHESDAGHSIELEALAAATAWLERVLTAG